MSVGQLAKVDVSRIHGMGLFATRRIESGEVIGVIQGLAVKKDGPFVLWISDDQGVEVTNALRFINHDEEPNACYYDDLKVSAIKHIEAGEEITHHYGVAWDKTAATAK
jgi:SET domain-containing protein